MLSLVLILTLSACAARGVIGIIPGATLPGAVVQPVFVATNRNPATGEDGYLFQQRFGESRDPSLRYVRLDVSIPPVHRTGQIEWPAPERPDLAKHFIVSAEHQFDGPQDFLAGLEKARPDGPREVVVFVHGYNVNNAEAVYRLAQIAHDFEAKVPVIAYSWPSAGSPRGYVYDRDSVIFSRDGLEILLTELTRDNRVLIVAHSMGSQLVMETLRQMSISGRGAVIERLSGVALISPDIDEDVFIQQSRRITPFPQPFMLLVSARDRMLDIAAFLTGKPTRLGSITEPGRLGDLPVTVIDLSDVQGGDPSGHSTAFTAPAAIALLRDLGG
ncbi:alpha/beta hydrolase [Tropicibacter oceani]|uniref:Alpha/beta fold hydrolase n=1 Tax=Tropicibacter oceani TaxID=3058420 RepID=A0ABY8QD31_9RHOB|nr:alpha/beta fold hydrolase [Tropicibacter oceani]WGW02531.1 alpha/beta fold hydrolase [Tropicibacter oceani]